MIECTFAQHRLDGSWDALWQAMRAATRPPATTVRIVLPKGAVSLDVVEVESIACLVRGAEYRVEGPQSAATGGSKEAAQIVERINRVLPALEVIEYDQQASAYVARTRRSALDASQVGRAYFEVLGAPQGVSLFRYLKPDRGPRQRIDFPLTRSAFETLVMAFDS
jgi:hypothetical protein